MTRQHASRTTLIASGLMLVLLAVPVVLMWRAWRQTQLDQALIAAVEQGYTKPVLVALARGANPNATDSEYRNVSNWQQWLLRLRGRHWGNQNSSRTALLLAVGGGQPVLTQMTMTNGQIVYETSDRGYRFCLEKETDEPAIVAALINKGANLDAKGYMGRTPLMWAINDEFMQTASILLSNGANPNLRDDNGDTALMLADRNANLIRLLKNAGAK